MSAAKAKGLLKFLLSQSGRFFLAFIQDVLTTLSIVSRAFQKEDACVGDVLYEVDSAKENLKKLKTRFDPRYFICSNRVFDSNKCNI